MQRGGIQALMQVSGEAALHILSNGGVKLYSASSDRQVDGYRVEFEMLDPVGQTYPEAARAAAKAATANAEWQSRKATEAAERNAKDDRTFVLYCLLPTSIVDKNESIKKAAREGVMLI